MRRCYANRLKRNASQAAAAKNTETEKSIQQTRFSSFAFAIVNDARDCLHFRS